MTFSERLDAIRRGLRHFRQSRAGRKKGRMRTVLLVLSFLILVTAFAVSLASLSPKPLGEKIRLDQLNALAKKKAIVVATFRDEDALVAGTYECVVPPPPKPVVQPAPAASASPAANPSPSAAPTPSASPAPVPQPLLDCPAVPAEHTVHDFWMPYPKSDLATGSLMTLVTQAGAHVQVDQQTGKANLRLVTTFVLPLIMLANLFALLFSAGRAGGTGIGDVIVFGSFKRGRVRKGRSRRVTFEDVAGAEHAVAEVAEIVDYLRNPERYRAIGAQAPKGVLMIGPPGCGKTLIAKACAGEADVPFFSVAGAEFVESLVGVGAARVRDLFRRVRASAPAIVFIDELDAAGRRRGAGSSSGGSDEREQTLNQLLVEMDGFDASSGIVVMGATNRPDILDPALLRPGRFDRQVTVDQPDRDGRAAILKLHARDRVVAPDVEFDMLARRTPGFSGAELANAINEAALLAIRADKTQVGMEELLEGVERVLAGPQRRGHVLTAMERLRVASHEAGHAIVSAAVGRAEEVHRVSILRRARTAGSTLLDSESGLMTRSAIRAQIAMLMAGLAAEEMVTGEPSSAAENDIEEATHLARDLIARYGMNPRLGRPRLVASAADAFLDDRIPLGNISAPTHDQVDEELRRLLDEAEASAREILRDNAALFEEMVRRLESEETVEGHPLEELLGRVGVRHSDNGSARKTPARKNGRQAGARRTK